jgi:hypothetical protein
MGEKALTAVIQETYIRGISTHSVDDPVQAMRISGISKSDPPDPAGARHRQRRCEPALGATPDPS